MSTSFDIVAKLWNLCNVLRDDGVQYCSYVTELTYLLFLKMAEEQGKKVEASTPPRYRWATPNELIELRAKRFSDLNFKEWEHL